MVSPRSLLLQVLIKNYTIHQHKRDKIFFEYAPMQQIMKKRVKHKKKLTFGEKS
jgi:L-rhamnose mutarotase